MGLPFVHSTLNEKQQVHAQRPRAKGLPSRKREREENANQKRSKRLKEMSYPRNQ